LHKLKIPVGILSISPDAMLWQKKIGFTFSLVAGDYEDYHWRSNVDVGRVSEYALMCRRGWQ